VFAQAATDTRIFVHDGPPSFVNLNRLVGKRARMPACFAGNAVIWQADILVDSGDADTNVFSTGNRLQRRGGANGDAPQSLPPLAKIARLLPRDKIGSAQPSE
jgi:hypothetical protein